MTFVRNKPRLVQTAAMLAGCLFALACASTGPKADNQSDPLETTTILREGSMLLMQDEPELALERFQLAASKQPNNPTVHNMVGLSLIALERLDDAVSSFNRALALVPAFTDARNNRGVSYLRLGNYRLAEIDFTAVLGDPVYQHRRQVYYNLALTHMSRNDLARAEENFLRSVSPPSPILDGYIQLAAIANKQGSIKKQVSRLTEATSFFPDNIALKLELGRSLLDAGETREGRHLLRSLRELAPGTSEAAAASVLLGSE